MPEEVGTETTRTDGPGEDEQDSGAKTAREPRDCGDAGEQGTGEENTREAQGGDDNGDEAASPEDLKVVVSIKGGRATIGVQQPSSDTHIETFDDRDLSGLTGELPAARAGWQESLKHPAYQRPAPAARRRNRRGQGATQASNAAETEHAQQQTLKLF